MPDTNIAPERPARADASGRTAIVAEMADRLDRATKHAKNLWWWIGGLIGLVIALAAAITWVGSVTRASGTAEESKKKIADVQGQVDEVKTQQADMVKRLDEHVQDERAERASMHEDIRTALIQTMHIAEKIHAPVEPLPIHEKTHP